MLRGEHLPRDTSGLVACNGVEISKFRPGKHAAEVDNVRSSVETGSPSLLFSLPLELRQKIFGYVFAMSPGSAFPPQSLFAKSRLFGLVGNKYVLPSPASTWTGSPGPERCQQSLIATNVQALVLCRQLHGETRLMPFQLNEVCCPVTFGSNTSATRHFIDALRPFQRRAIKELEIHLLASVTEAWAFTSILRSIAGLPQTDSQRSETENDDRDEVGFERTGADRSLISIHDPGKLNTPTADLKSLTIHITTRDLMLPQADSLPGLLHILNITPAWDLAACSSPAYGTASWATEGLVHLMALGRLKIILETSVFAAKQVSIPNRNTFAQALKKYLPWVPEIQVQWRVQKDVILRIDDSEWVDFMWLNNAISASSPVQESGNGDDIPGQGTSRDDCQGRLL